jgi:hypothetical protein
MDGLADGWVAASFSGRLAYLPAWLVGVLEGVCFLREFDYLTSDTALRGWGDY